MHKMVLVGLLVCWLVSGCMLRFDATERERLRAEAAMERARADREMAVANSQAVMIAAVSNAMRPNYWPFVICILVAGGVAGTWLYWRGKTHFEIEKQRALGLLSAPNNIRILPPAQYGIPLPVLREAVKRGGVAKFDEQEGRWLIVDAQSGRVLARQQKLLTSK